MRTTQKKSAESPRINVAFEAEAYDKAKWESYIRSIIPDVAKEELPRAERMSPCFSESSLWLPCPYIHDAIAGPEN